MKLNLSMIFILILLVNSCKNDDDIVTPSDINYRQEMRTFVVGISGYSKAIRNDFSIIPQNGIELISSNGEEEGEPNLEYISAIDGNGQEDLFYGYIADNQSTPTVENNYLRTFLTSSKNAGNKILVTDYCATPSKMDDAYNQNYNNGFVSFSADNRELNNIPLHPKPIYSENKNNVSSLSQIQNFLYLINPENFNSKLDFIAAVTATNYDLLIMDLFYTDGAKFTSAEINELKNKANGGKRLVICYMSIGEAENYRYYWQTEWRSNKPSWLDEENPDWAGNYKVKYWDKNWQDIIYGNNNSYLKLILDSDFDGVYLDIIDAFEYYE